MFWCSGYCILFTLIEYSILNQSSNYCQSHKYKINLKYKNNVRFLYSLKVSYLKSIKYPITHSNYLNKIDVSVLSFLMKN